LTLPSIPVIIDSNSMSIHRHTHAKKQVPAVRAEHVTIAFGQNAAVDDVSFEVKEGSITALIGPNGSGKTTMLRAILGLQPTTKGSVTVFGRHPHDARGDIGYVPQRFGFDAEFPITVGEFMSLSRRKACDSCSPDQAISDVGLPVGILSERLGSLSGGQLQRVLIAQAILNNPPLLVLDEPSTGVDVAGEAAFYEVLEHLNHEHGTTVLIVSHDVSVIAKIVDEVLCLNRKLLCAGPPAKALSQKAVSDLYGQAVDVYEHSSHPFVHHSHRGS